MKKIIIIIQFNIFIDTTMSIDVISDHRKLGGGGLGGFEESKMSQDDLDLTHRIVQVLNA